LLNGKKNRFSPKVFGQSGTAMPTPLLVTTPPNPTKKSVAAAVSKAKRFNQQLLVDRVIDSTKRIKVGLENKNAVVN
jgi:hypothetical protein